MKAVMISVNFDMEDVKAQFHEQGENPILSLKCLWESIKDDWPGYETMVFGDKAAMDVWARFVVSQLTGSKPRHGD